MKKMKALTSLILILLLCCTLISGCASDNNTESDAPPSAPPSPAAATEPPAPQVWEFTLDGAYSMEADPELDLFVLFGSALRDYGAVLRIYSDGSFEYHIGVLSGYGSWYPDGDTGRYIADIVEQPHELNMQLIFHEFRESEDSETYLALYYMDHVLYWNPAVSDS